MYVCNQNSASISVINVSSLEVETTIDLQSLGFSENAKPHHAAVEPDGSFWYVTLIGENRVLKFNRENELVAQTEMEVPGLLALHPTKDILFVGRSMSAVNPPQSFGMVSRSDMALNEEIDLFFTRPHAIATTADNKHVFVASLVSNQILSVDTETREQELITMEGMNHVFVNFAISPDQTTLVGTTQMTGKLFVFDIEDPLSPQLDKAIDVNAQPWHPVYSHDGARVYFGNKEGNSITVVDMTDLTIEKVIEHEGIAQPHGAALSSGDKYLFVTNNNMKMMMNMGGTDQKKDDHSGHGSHSNHEEMEMAKPGMVTVVDTETLEVVKVIPVGMNPTGIGSR
ncbi:MAG: YncE family protein [Balneola sp.]|nr:MAG: YncE family protein [Balneola sp.]